MKLESISIRNFRRLENVDIDMEDKETIFVGPNNSGKTSATAVFRCFLGGREFRIHDFSVASLLGFNSFVETGDSTQLPELQLDIWFSIDPQSIAFGRVFALLPKLEDLTRVGVRLSYGIADPAKLLSLYAATYPVAEDGSRGKSLFQYLSMDGNLRKSSRVHYESLEVVAATDASLEVKATPIAPEEGAKLVKELLQVEFVDAQRNINDDDSSRSNRLSAAFADYYKKNLTKPQFAADAHEVIDRNNEELTKHYKVQFKPLIELIEGLGVPSVNDRSLRLVSSLSAETALRGSTDLLYVDSKTDHELPELYNGLGFKNLIYMAIQAQHLYLQWLSTAKNRPLCLLIFIEEPEVHLHAQVQQTFIGNIWSVIRTSVQDTAAPMPQLVVTTHSSHILDAVDFDKVRYFQRSHSLGSDTLAGIQNASRVQSLRAFQPNADVEEGLVVTQEDARKFLKKYIRLTHCDLFFADAVILVEGAVEKLLMPSMIQQSAGGLRTKYISILEVGGAYAHRFEGLLGFLNIPYLIITDLDSIARDSRSTCRADTADARTSNACLKQLLSLETVADLIALEPSARISEDGDRCVTYQGATLVQENESSLNMIARTIEEALVFENFDLARGGQINIGVTIPADLVGAYQAIHERVRSDTFKKTEFALRLLSMDDTWVTPAYIAFGLQWLERRLQGSLAVSNALNPESALVDA
jgi:putative ATP-dependent endonuclease of OLD family